MGGPLARPWPPFGQARAALRAAACPEGAARWPPGRPGRLGPPFKKRGGPKGGPKGRPGRAEGRPGSGQRAAHRAALPPSPLCEMRGQLENELRGSIFAHFFWRVRDRCTFPAAPLPSAASQAHQRPRPVKSTTYGPPVPRKAVREDSAPALRDRSISARRKWRTASGRSGPYDAAVLRRLL